MTPICETSRSQKNHRERGSALFIIFVGIALFAALSFAVAQIMRGGNPEVISQQKARLFADEIIDYGRVMRQTVQAAKVSGCEDTSISFDTPAMTGYAHGSPPPEECEVFNGATYMPPARDWLDLTVTPTPALQGQWLFTGEACAPGIGNGAAGCQSDSEDNEELVLYLPYIKKEICIQINEVLGITENHADPPVEAGNAWSGAGNKFAGTYQDGQSLDQTRITGCFEGAGTPAGGTYHFYQILLTR